MIEMQYHPHFLRCSAANRMHVYVVDSLIGFMFTNGSGRTADVLYSRGSPVHFAHKPAPAWTRIICKQRKKVYNKCVSTVINKGIHGKQVVCFCKNGIEQTHII